MAGERFIPAGAGNTLVKQGTIATFVGLSPLARGTPAQVRRVRRQRRFIPAGAGNTADTPDDEIIVAVYPRWRGEHAAAASKYGNAAGLSPLARGTPTLSRSQ